MLSAKTQYACLAVLELAAHHGAGDPVQLRRIAAAHDIPSGFLVQILLQLKHAGFVQSTRGASGGYHLAHPPEEITLWDIISVFQPPRQERMPPARQPLAAALRDACRDAQQAAYDRLRSITFSALVEQARRETESMYYI